MKYIATYAGAKARTFSTVKTIEESKKQAEEHAAENARTKGEYIIYIIEELTIEGLVKLCGTALKGKKKGRLIGWEEN